jgi:hypothetical protein
MEADKNSFRRRLKLQQDELARSDPKITCSALLPSVCQNDVATGVLLVLGTNTTSSLDSYTNTAAETTRELVDWRGRSDRVWGAVRPPPPGDKQLKSLFQAPKHSTVSPTEISGQGQASYQVILARTKTSSRGLGAFRLATRGVLTSCTQQRTPSKNS